MAARPETTSLSLSDFQESLEPLFHVEITIPSKTETSKELWPKYSQMVAVWKTFVRKLFKEAVEVVFSKLASSVTNSDESSLCLQQVVARSFLHHSSFSMADSTAEGAILQLGATEMSKLMISDPTLWSSHFESYKTYLLGRCDQLVPVFEGEKGIDQTFMDLFGISDCVSLSSAILKSSPLPVLFHYSVDGEYQISQLSLCTTESLNTLLHLYYAIYCLTSDKDPNCFLSLDGPLFDSPSKPNFQKMFGDIPGDYLHYLHKCVSGYGKDAYIYCSEYRSSYNFFWVLAHRLFDAISCIVSEHFGISLDSVQKIS